MVRRVLRFPASFPLVMSSYLRSWLPSLSLQQSSPAPATTDEEESPTTPTPTVPSLSVQNPDDDSPPAFPAIESAQRISHVPSTLMPPPPVPSPRIPGPTAPSSSSSSSLMPPPSTTKPPSQLSKSKARGKVVLAPGHSPLDWAALKCSGADLRVCSLSLLIVNLHKLTILSLYIRAE